MTTKEQQAKGPAKDQEPQDEEVQRRPNMKEPTGGFERHALSFAYPKMTAHTGFNGLVISMRTYGYDKSLPVVIFEGAIIDGWNRYNAAADAGVEPVYAEFVGTLKKARDFVQRHNSFRRHMAVDRQCYAIRAIEVTLPLEDQHTPEEIADIVGTRLSVAEKAFQMHRDHPELARQVVEGNLSAETAEIQVGLKSANANSKSATMLAVTNARIIRRFNNACEADPGRRLGIRPKTAINDLVRMWCKAREEGKTIVISENNDADGD